MIYWKVICENPAREAKTQRTLYGNFIVSKQDFQASNNLIHYLLHRVRLTDRMSRRERPKRYEYYIKIRSVTL